MSASKQAYVPSQFTLYHLPYTAPSWRTMELDRLISGRPNYVLHSIIEAKLKCQTSPIKTDMHLTNTYGEKEELSDGWIQLRSSNLGQSLKREIELLVGMIEKQSQEIKHIKTSKKYNRFVELQTTREVYKEQMADVARKMKSFQFVMREQRRVFREYRRREKGMRDMSKAVRQQITTNKNEILNEIDQINDQIKKGYHKQFSLKREKERIVKEILELQRKTGKMYLSQHQKEEESPQKPLQNEQPEPPHNKFTSQAEKDDPRCDSDCQQYEQEQYETQSSCDEESDSESNQDCIKREKTDEHRSRRLNISF